MTRSAPPVAIPAAPAARPAGPRPAWARTLGPALRLALPLACLSGTPAPAAEDDDGRAAVLSVSVRPARNQCFPDRIEVTGVLAPRETIDVGVDREGMKVAQVLVAPLDRVSAAQVLARLVPQEGAGEAAAAVALRAPAAGLVLRVGAVAGQPASPRQGPLFQVVRGGEIELQAEVALSGLGRLAAGQEVAVRPLGLPEVAGRVRRVEGAADPAAQVGRVAIALRDATEARVGTFARGVVAVGRRCGVGVPYAAVQYEQDATIVQVVDGTRVETRQVTVGLLAGEDAEIRSGLSESDLVVVRAGAFLREGDRVAPIPVDAAR